MNDTIPKIELSREQLWRVIRAMRQSKDTQHYTAIKEALSRETKKYIDERFAGMEQTMRKEIEASHTLQRWLAREAADFRRDIAEIVELFKKKGKRPPQDAHA